jgi:hypothetical protein
MMVDGVEKQHEACMGVHPTSCMGGWVVCWCLLLQRVARRCIWAHTHTSFQAVPPSTQAHQSPPRKAPDVLSW